MLSPLLVSHSPGSTIALVLPLGVKFYSELTDGTVLISANFPSRARRDWSGAVDKFAERKTAIPSAFIAHQGHQAALAVQHGALHDALEFAAYTHMSDRETA